MKNKKRGPVRSTSDPFAYLKQVDDRLVVAAFIIILVAILFLFDALTDEGYISRSPVIGGVFNQGEGDQAISKLIIENREDDGVAFIIKDTVDPELLEEFTNNDYGYIKGELGIDSDFTIHFEDEKGNVIPIGGKLCFGKDGATVNGIPCGK
jgi:hypothetical protein